MNPNFRRWWRLLDDLPHDLAKVTVWAEGPPPPLLANGHLHAAPTVIACLEGVLRVVSPNQTLDLVAGQALAIGAGVWHRHEPLRRGSCWVGLECLPAFNVITIADHEREWHGRLPSHPSRRLMEAVLRAATDEERIDGFRVLLRQVLMERIDQLQWDNPALQRMIARLNASLYSGVHAMDLVRASRLSRAQAYRVFKEGYGMALKDAIDINRLWLAESLLTQGMSITAAAKRSGWPSADTFARSWKRHYGAPPSLLMRPADGVPAAAVDHVANQVAATASATNAEFPRQMACADAS